MPNDREQRLRQREEIKQERMERFWPGICPTCRALPGERCTTQSGGRAVRHKGRLRSLDVETVMHVDKLQQWPTLFPPGKTLGECMELAGYERRHANWWSKPDAVRLGNCVGDSWEIFVAEGIKKRSPADGQDNVDEEERFRAVGPDYVIPEPADDTGN